MSTDHRVRHCTVYRGHGQIDEMELEAVDREIPFPAPDCVPIRTIMAYDLLCVRADLEIATVVNLMIEHHVGCLPVVDERRRPIGVITKFDLVEQLDAAMRLARGDSGLPSELAAQLAEDVMMPIVMTLDEHATIAHASSMMISEDTHHVLVVSEDGTLIGVASAKDIVRWVTEHETLLVRRETASAPPAWRPLEG